VQAGNETLNAQDREAIQGEITQLMAELDRINETTNFNNKKVFSQHQTVSLEQSYANGGELSGYKVTYQENEDLSGLGLADAEARREFALAGLKGGWLQESERMIEEQFGLIGSGQSINIDFVDGGDASGGSAAFVSGFNGDTSLRMHIDLHDFDDTNSPDGGTPNMYSDRIIAHEMVHVAMFATGLFQGAASDAWFNEGAAELLHGAADTRLAGDTDAELQTHLDNALNDSPIDYGGAYLAAAFLHEEIKDAGGTGIKDLFTALQAGDSFNGALVDLTRFNSRQEFADALTGADGNTDGLDLAIRLRDTAALTGDSGAVGGSILDGGPVQNARDIVANETYSTEDKKGGQKIDFHIGAGAEDNLGMYVGSFNVDAMGLRNIDLTNHSKVDFALSGLDDALNYVADMRADLGAMQNRLTSTINSLQVNVENTSASRSRIIDADFAAETLSLSKAQIVQQASTSMLAQANVQPQLALALLN
jgi:flagellin